ncbi:MAG TPA: NAD(P)H-binding protein [Candidatus Acidoferrales bacterium]|nr:NAD(P)H-binding protein [Candidatus Acidoferrales bacterium]
MTVVTGATGRTGRRVVETLLAKDERVRAIGRDATRLVPLAKLGAEAFVGNAEDAASMTAAFDGTSGVYLVLPEDLSQPDLHAHQERVSDSYAVAFAARRLQEIIWSRWDLGV